MSATAGANPAKLSCLHRGFAFCRAPIRQIGHRHRYQAGKDPGIGHPRKFGTGSRRTATTVTRPRHNLIFKSTPTWNIRILAQERIR